MTGDPRISTCGHFFCDACEEEFGAQGCRAAKECRNVTKPLLVTAIVLDSLAKGNTGRQQTGSGNLRSSPKFDKLLELLDEVPHEAGDPEAPREKTIIFSQWTGALDLLQPHLDKKRLMYERIDGTMQPTQRTDALARFREDPEV